MNNSEKLGYLRPCMDRRFVASVRAAFEKATGLGETDYWHEGNPGGSANEIDPLGADYAYAHGARFMGWAAHGDRCGGNPGKTDAEIAAQLDENVKKAQKKYPEAAHYRIFSTEKETKVDEVK